MTGVLRECTSGATDKALWVTVSESRETRERLRLVRPLEGTDTQ